MKRLIIYFILSTLTFHAQCQVNIGVLVDRLCISKYEEGVVYVKMSIINYSSDTVYILNHYTINVCVGDSIKSDCEACLIIKNYSNLVLKEGIDVPKIRPDLPQNIFVHDQKLKTYKKSFLDFNRTNIIVGMHNMSYYLVKPNNKISFYVMLNCINHDFDLLHFTQEKKSLYYSEFKMRIKYNQEKNIPDNDFIYSSKSNRFKILMK